MSIPWERLADPQTSEALLAGGAWIVGTISLPFCRYTWLFLKGAVAAWRRRREVRRQAHMELLAAQVLATMDAKTAPTPATTTTATNRRQAWSEHKERIKAAVAKGYLPTVCDECGQMTVLRLPHVTRDGKHEAQCQTCGTTARLS